MTRRKAKQEKNIKKPAAAPKPPEPTSPPPVEGQMTQFVKEYKGDGEYLSMHHR